MADAELTLTPDATFNEHVEHVLSLVGDDDATEATPSETVTTTADDPAPEAPASGDTQTTEDAGVVEPVESPAIELPATFTDELRTALKSLPVDLQQKFAQWESARQRGVNQRLEESATKGKTYDTQLAALNQERQRAADTLNQAITLAQTFNPILADAAKMTPDDWAKLANDAPAEYLRKTSAVQAEQYKVHQAIAERDRLMQTRNGEAVQREHGALIKAIPDLADPVKAKAFATDLDKTMAEYGYTPQEVAQVVDHRAIRVARDAMLYRQGEAQRVAAAAKAKQVVPKVQRPGTGEQVTPRNDALRKRIAGMTSLSDQADALAALIGE